MPGTAASSMAVCSSAANHVKGSRLGALSQTGHTDCCSATGTASAYSVMWFCGRLTRTVAIARSPANELSGSRCTSIRSEPPPHTSGATGSFGMPTRAQPSSAPVGVPAPRTPRTADNPSLVGDRILGTGHEPRICDHHPRLSDCGATPAIIAFSNYGRYGYGQSLHRACAATHRDSF